MSYSGNANEGGSRLTSSALSTNSLSTGGSLSTNSLSTGSFFFER